MSTALGNPTTKPTAAERKSPAVWIAGVLIVAAVVAGGAYAMYGRGGEAEADVDGTVHVVGSGDMVISVAQKGTIEATNKEVIRSKVRKGAEVAWLIAEGTDVQAGDVLVKLDKTALLDKKDDDEQNLESAKSSLFAAQVSEQNTISQANSDTDKARLDYEFAELALKKYIEGEYPQQIKQAEGEVKLQRDTLLRAKDKMEWSQRLYKEGYITQSEADADAAAFDKAQLDLEVAEGELEVLKKYTHYEQRRKLESDVEQKRDALERVTNKARADTEKAKVDVATAKSKVQRLERELDDTIEDLKNCDITAPVNGRVVYAQQGSRWRREEPISEGATVRLGQELIHLPEAGAMSVDIKIDEVQRHKLRLGMPVLITGPSLPEAGVRGELVRIAEYLDPSGWWNNYEQKYSGTVNITSDISTLRTGMNCLTEIIVAYYNDVISVPLHAVIRVDGQTVVYDADTQQPIPVEIGLDDDSRVHIVSGLKVGQRIMLNPPLEASERDAASETRDMSGAREASPNTGNTPHTGATTRPRESAGNGGGGGGGGGGGRFDPNMLKSSPLWQHLSDDAKQKIDQLIEDKQAGKAVKVDSELRQAIRNAMKKMREGGSTGDREGGS